MQIEQKIEKLIALINSPGYKQLISLINEKIKQNQGYLDTFPSLEEYQHLRLLSEINGFEKTKSLAETKLNELEGQRRI